MTILSMVSKGRKFVAVPLTLASSEPLKSKRQLNGSWLVTTITTTILELIRGSLWVLGVKLAMVDTDPTVSPEAPESLKLLKSPTESTPGSERMAEQFTERLNLAEET